MEKRTNTNVKNAGRPTFIFQEITVKGSEIDEKSDELAKQYTYGSITVAWNNREDCQGSWFDVTYPVVNGKCRSVYQGEHADWRYDKIFETLKKEFKKDKRMVFNRVFGNKIPPLVWAYRFVVDPIECVRLGCTPVASGKISQRYRNGIYELMLNRAIWAGLEQHHATILEKNIGFVVLDGQTLLPNGIYMSGMKFFDEEKLAEAVLLSAIKVSKPRDYENMVPESSEEEWAEILRGKKNILKKMSNDEKVHSNF